MLSLLQFIEQSGESAKIGVARIIEKYTKLAPRLPVKAVDRLNHNYGKETSLGEVGKRAVNQPAPDTKPGIVTPASEPIIMLTRKIKTDHRLAALNPNARGEEAARGTRAIARVMDDELVNGNRLADATSINGLLTRCTGNQVITAGPNGAVLNAGHLQAALDAVQDQGNGKLIVMNRPTYRQLVANIMTTAGGATVAEMTSELPTFESSPIVILGDKLNGTQIFAYDEVQGSDDETCSAMVIAPGNDDVELSGVKLLMASNSIELISEGIRDSQHVDVLEVAFGLACYDDTAVARIKGIAKAA